MADNFFTDIRQWLGNSRFSIYFRRVKLARTHPKYFLKKKNINTNQRQSIIFLCPANDAPSGGVKVIYNQAALINKIDEGLIASVLHPYKPEFICTWFDHKITVKKNLGFDPRHDFVMIPEFWAVPHARLLQGIGVRYGIYVQGGYVMGLWGSQYGEAHDFAYDNAALILAISDDTAECIKMAYPKCEDRLYRVHCSINPDKFLANLAKENIISYMPRKLQKHSELVAFFLNKNMPPHWKIEGIDGLDEDGVAAILGRSRIFLSFSELEGLSLPPIEAALSGCYVIGYTGEAAKEYWDAEIFTEIHSGDIKSFVRTVLNKIDEIDNSPSTTHDTAIQKLASRYSAQVELADMQFVSNKILEILSDVNPADGHS